MQSKRSMDGRRATLLFLAALLTAILPATGCSGDGDGDSVTLDSLIKDALGADKLTPTEQAAMAFDQNDPDVRRRAIELLSNKSWALRDPYLKRVAVLTKPGLEPNASVRAVAVRMLGRAGNTKYRPEILDALDDPSPVVRWDAAIVLDTMSSKKAVLKLQKLAINDESSDVRAAAAKSLRHFRTDEVHQTLLRCLDDNDFIVRHSAHAALVFQTGQDRGINAENWVDDPTKIGSESLPVQTVRYKKRPWWDWYKITDETEVIADTPTKEN